MSLLLLANGFSLFMDHFYFGVGPKMLLSYIAPYFVGNEELIVYTHNMLLDIAVEYGIIGVALLFFWGGGARAFGKSIQNETAEFYSVFVVYLYTFYRPFGCDSKHGDSYVHAAVFY